MYVSAPAIVAATLADGEDAARGLAARLAPWTHGSHAQMFIGPTTVGIAAAAKAVEDDHLTGKVNVTGLGLPSQMAGHVKSGASKSFALWNPIDLGYAATMSSYNLATHKAKAEPGAKIDMGRMGTVTLDKNNIGVMSDPFTFNASNVDKYAKMF